MMKYKTLYTTILAAAFSLSAYAADPYEKPDGSYISLTGEVASSTPSAFILDYGEGLVTVEMDDWEWYADGYMILPEDQVTVYGYVDDDFYETTSIEASSVYVEDLNTYFYASGADEESLSIATAAIYDLDFEITGEITAIDGREFKVDTGERTVTVDTWQLGYNPVDDQGYLRLDVGDRVTVFGDLDRDVFDNRELSAETIIKLQADERQAS